MRCYLRALLILATLLAGSRSAGAQAPPEPEEAGYVSPVAVDLGIDGPVIVSAGLLGGSLNLLREELVRTRCAPEPGCAEGAVNAFDATTLGRYSEAAILGGNILVGTTLLLPSALGALDAALSGDDGEGWLGYGKDTLILAEVLVVSIGVHQLTVFAARRPRPYVYSDSVSDELRGEANSYLSFYSGHTANSFALATAFSYLFTLRHPESRWTAPVWTLTHGLCALEGYLRVTAGYHYWSDVLVGAAIGSSIGLLIPWLHTTGGSEAGAERPAVTLIPTPVAGAGAGVSLLIR